LVDEHLSLVRALAAKVRGQLGGRIEIDELVNLGILGLMEAADRFDPNAGVKFSTFAYYRIRGAIFDGVRQMNHLPRSIYAKARLIERADSVTDNLSERECGAGPAKPQASLEDNVQRLHDAFAGVVASYVTSLEALAAEGAEFASGEAGAEEVLVIAETERRVIKLIATLPEKERHFVQKHYFEGKSLQDAGKELGLSKSWASRLHSRALEMIREKLEKSAA
jgi:RNA polymerase sigma factor for flagellar operon FliA